MDNTNVNNIYIQNVLEWLEHTALCFPHKTAFGDSFKKITFDQLVRKAQAIGVFLADKITIGSSVAFYMEKSVDALAAMFGVIYAGGFYSFVDVRQPIARAEKVLNVLAPDVVLMDDMNVEKSNALQNSYPNAEWIHIKELLENADRLVDNGKETEGERIIPSGEITYNLPEKLAEIRERMTDNDILYVNFTSGSTGIPKGVAVCHRSVIEFITHFVPLFGINEKDVIANQAPFDFDVSVKDIYSGIYSGAQVQLVPRKYFTNPMKLMDYLCDYNATVLIWAVSAMCFVSIMNALDYRTPETVRMVMFSGEVMPVKQLNIWKKHLPYAVYVNLYGPTEITCNCTYYILPPERKWEPADVIPVGKPFENEKVFLLDEQDQLVVPSSQRTSVKRQTGLGKGSQTSYTEPANPNDSEEGNHVERSEGEICVGGTCLAIGYYRDPERTNAVFVQNPLNDRYPERIYRTGDIGRYDADGNLVYVSRKDFQIKHMGHRIELGEIEADVMARDGVSRATCIYDPEKKRLILFYMGKRKPKDLERELKTVLPPFMMPNKTIRLDEMPLNKNGKIDRNTLRGLLELPVK